MYFNMDIFYSSIIILASLYISFLYIRDFKNGKYKPYISYKVSAGTLIDIFLIVVTLKCLYSISDNFIAKITAVSTLLIFVLVINILNCKCYFSRKENRIIIETLIIDSLMIGLILFIFYAV